MFQSGMVPRVGFEASVCYHCRISPPRFLAVCRKRRLNHGSFVLLFFRFTLSDLYLVTVCLFSCTALFVSISQLIGCEDRLRNDLLCVRWGVKLDSLTQSGMDMIIKFLFIVSAANLWSGIQMASNYTSQWSNYSSEAIDR